MMIWWSPQNIADARLPGLPSSRRAINKIVKRERWDAAVSKAGEPLARRRKARGGGFEYHQALVEKAIKDRGHKLLKVQLPLAVYLSQDDLTRLESLSARSKLPVKTLVLTLIRHGVTLLEQIQ